MDKKQIYIKMNELAKVYAFAELAQKIQGDVIVKRGIWQIDGKSALGLFAIDLTKGGGVVYPANAYELEAFLKEFEVKS